MGKPGEREGTELPFLGRLTSRLANLRRGAAQGRRARGAARPRHPPRRAAQLLPSRPLWEGPGRAPPGCGATWRAPYERAGSPGGVPEQQQRQPKGPSSLLGGSSPSSAGFPPPCLASFLFRSPPPRGPRASLVVPCSRSPSPPPASGYPLVAAPRVRASPQGGRC